MMVQPWYFGWFDDNPKASVVSKIDDAIDAFMFRFKVNPTLVLVNETDNATFTESDVALHHAHVIVRKSDMVRRNNFWVGVE